MKKFKQINLFWIFPFSLFCFSDQLNSCWNPGTPITIPGLFWQEGGCQEEDGMFFSLRRDYRHDALISRWSEVWALEKPTEGLEQRQTGIAEKAFISLVPPVPGPKSSTKYMTLGKFQSMPSAAFCVPDTVQVDITS